MIDFKKINYLAIGIAGFVLFCIQGIWYGLLFGVEYVKQTGQSMDAPIFITVVMLFVGTLFPLGISIIYNMINKKSFINAIIVSLIIFFTVILSYNLPDLIYVNKPVLFLINTGYMLIASIVSGVSIGLLQK